MIAGAAVADTISVPNQFQSGATISSTQVNDNFTALVTESNLNDARISALENATGNLRPVWVDANGVVLGLYDGSDQALVTFAEAPNIAYKAGVSSSGVFQQSIIIRWTDGCSGGEGVTTSSFNSPPPAVPGPLGVYYIPDITQPVESINTNARTSTNLTGSYSCYSPSYETPSGYKLIPTDTPVGYGLTFPLHVELR